MSNNSFDSPDIFFKDKSIQLSTELVQALNAKVGDKIHITYSSQNDELIPIIEINEQGKKLRSNNTISCSQHQRDVLSQFGNVFIFKEFPQFIKLVGNDNPIYTTAERAAHAVLTEQIINNTDYLITKLNTYEF